jgi:phage terminase small subunit
MRRSLSLLTKKKQAFIAEYCAHPEIGKAEAAAKAGFSRKRAGVTACELMKDPEVQAEINRKLNHRLDAIAGKDSRGKKVDQAAVLQELQDIIDAARMAGSGAWQMTARLKAVELQGKFLKMFTDKVEIGVDDALMEKLLEGRKRAGLQTIEATPVLELTEGDGTVQ